MCSIEAVGIFDFRKKYIFCNNFVGYALHKYRKQRKIENTHRKMSEVINIKELNERIERESVFVDTLRSEMGKVIIGQNHLIDTLLIGLLSNGHILLEGVPGLAKTLAITTLAKAVDAADDGATVYVMSDLTMTAPPVSDLLQSRKKLSF